MKKIIITSIFITTLNAEPIITEDMIFESIENAIVNGYKGLKKLGNYEYKTHVQGEKNYYWYFNKNQKMQRELKKKNIDYWTILKQKMYPVKVYDNSKEAERKKYIILSELSKQNNIKITKKENININQEEKEKEKRKNAKEELKKQMNF